MKQNISKREDLSDGFHAIPNKIMQISKYKGKPFGFSEKCTYCYLLSWSYSTDKVFPSMGKMCQDLGVSSRTSMKKYLDKLECLGLILVLREKGKSSTYKVIDFDTGEIVNPDKGSLNKGCNSERVDKPVVEVNTINECIDYSEMYFDETPEYEDLDWIPF